MIMFHVAALSALDAWSEPLAAALPLPEPRRERICRNLHRLGLGEEGVARTESIRAWAALASLFCCGALALIVPAPLELAAVLLLVAAILVGLRLPEEWLSWRSDRYLSHLERHLGQVWNRLLQADTTTSPQRVLEQLAGEFELSDRALSGELRRLSVHVRLEGVAAGAAHWARRLHSSEVDRFARRLADWERRGHA